MALTQDPCFYLFSLFFPLNESFAACDGDAATPAFDFLSESKDDTRHKKAKKLLEHVERLRVA